MYDTVFEILYWSLGGIMLVAFIAAIARSAAGLRRPSADRLQAEGILAIGIGASVTLVAGFSLNALRSVTGDLFYQQVHFALFYVAFGMILWGFDRVGMFGDHASRPGRAARTMVWAAFALATGLAVVGLLTPDSYRIVSGGEERYVQQPLFFLPLFVVLAAGAARLRIWLDPDERGMMRSWLAALAACMLLGMVRESNILPATNQPIVDLLLAFGPFTLAALCLLRAALVFGGRYDVSTEAVLREVVS
jgi:hypothetical protein